MYVPNLYEKHLAKYINDSFLYMNLNDLLKINA